MPCPEWPMYSIAFQTPPGNIKLLSLLGCPNFAYYFHLFIEYQMCLHFRGQCVFCWFNPSWRDDYGQETPAASWISPSSLRIYCGFSKLGRVLNSVLQDPLTFWGALLTQYQEILRFDWILLTNKFKVFPTTQFWIKYKTRPWTRWNIYFVSEFLSSNSNRTSLGRDGI